jgi:hypothetical protein
MFSEIKKEEPRRGPMGIEGLMDTPLKWTESTITSVLKRTAMSIWAYFKRYISTASEPLLRKNMGERYLSPDAVGGGATLWFLATVVATLFPDFRSVAPFLLNLAHLGRFAGTFQEWPATWTFGGALIFIHIKLGIANSALMGAYRAMGTPYHSQSRGIPRWGSPLVPILIIGLLFLFDLPAGILFVISIGMSAKLAGEQQAAIYARYLDALDQRIEKEYLEDAMLGKCPVEITQLHRPISSALDADLRKNIAAAAVGKPVAMVAKGGRSPGTPNADEPPTSSQPVNPRAGTTEPPTPQASHNPPTVAPTDSGNKKLFTGLLLILLLAGIVTGGVIHFWPTKPTPPKEMPVSVASHAESQTAPAKVAPTPSPPAAPMVKTQPVETQPVTAAPPIVAPTSPPVDTAALAREALEKNRHEEQQRIAQQRQKTIAQFKSLVDDKTAELAKLQTGSVGQLDDNTNKIAKAAWLRRSRLTRENEKARTIISRELENQQKALSVVRDSVQLVSSDPTTNPKDVASNIDMYNQIAAEVGQRITAALKAMDDEISGNAPNSGLIQVR